MVKKSTVVRAALLAFFEDLGVVRKNPETLQRCTNRFATDKMLYDTMRKILPGAKVSLLKRDSNRATTLTAPLTPGTLRCLGDLMSGSAVLKERFAHLEEYGCVPNRRASDSKAVILRAALCYFLLRINDLSRHPELYQRAMTVSNSEKVLCRIRDGISGRPRKG